MESRKPWGKFTVYPFGGMTEGGSDYDYQYKMPRRERLGRVVLGVGMRVIRRFITEL
ncbi:MAG: hypothetical protein K2O16_11195 [Lachnospiraceae bacterium]|nr:hypothetical protein [Lachnospiraceae bacterium]